MNIPEFIRSKNKQKTSWVTCYDASSAQLVKGTNISGVLVGDSLAMTIYGYKNTLKATMSMMKLHTEAVAKILEDSDKIIISDLPFLSYRYDWSKTLKAVKSLICAGAHGVKIEGAKGNLETIQRLVDSGIPVMGHIGLTPQFYHALGGFKIQGKSKKEQEMLLVDAMELEKAGCFSLVLEGIPSSFAAMVTQKLSIPTIGIGAGPNTDGQILVWHDLLGINENFKPKFVRNFAYLNEIIKKALNQYHEDVTHGRFPAEDECY